MFFPELDFSQPLPMTHRENTVVDDIFETSVRTLAQNKQFQIIPKCTLCYVNKIIMYEICNLFVCTNISTISISEETICKIKHLNYVHDNVNQLPTC